MTAAFQPSPPAPYIPTASIRDDFRQLAEALRAYRGEEIPLNIDGDFAGRGESAEHPLDYAVRVVSLQFHDGKLPIYDAHWHKADGPRATWADVLGYSRGSIWGANPDGERKPWQAMMAAGRLLRWVNERLKRLPP